MAEFGFNPATAFVGDVIPVFPGNLLETSTVPRTNTPNVYFESFRPGFRFRAEESFDLSGVLMRGEAVYAARPAMIMEEVGFATFSVDVRRTGWYALRVEYAPVVEHTTAGGVEIRGTGGHIERSIFIDGQVPFSESWAMEMTRFYVDLTENDNNGNVIPVSGNRFRPLQDERERWNVTTLGDQFGYFGKALYFYLEAGTRQISIRSIREPVAIYKIDLVSTDDFELMSYADYLAMHRANGAQDISRELLATNEIISHVDRQGNRSYTDMNNLIYIAGEAPFEKGDPTLFAFNDTMSTKTLPHNNRVRLMNAIGGENWKFPNQWISWEFEVPESGFYNISFRVRQTFQRDVNTNRAIYINGEIPFAEAASIQFPFNNNWYTTTARGGGENYRFYLEAGTNYITLMNTPGVYTDILIRTQYVMDNLTRINLEFISIITASPDRDRDYHLGRRMPHIFVELRYNADHLREIRREMRQINGGRQDALTSQLDQLIQAVERMYNRPDDVPQHYRRFRDQILGLGTWMMTVREHALIVDRIIISEPGHNVSVKEDNFLDRLWVIIVQFIDSFFTNYSMLSEGLGSNYVTVWIGGATGGRDQALAFNQIIVRDFTSDPNGTIGRNIPVNLQLVGTGVVLVATLAGRGPDVTLSVGVGDPVNFALRSAVADLTQFDDFWCQGHRDTGKCERHTLLGCNYVSCRFFPGTLTPFFLDKEDGRGIGVYALPETATFPMLFYRTDVLQDIEIDPTELRTWQNIIEMYPELLAQNMEFGLPSNFGTYMMLLFQMEGDLYKDGFTGVRLDEKLALDAFKFFTDFYLELSMPIDFDFVNRLRTGEMPAAIADYTQFNMISIFAPELRGRWNMVPVPGFERECAVTGETIIDATAPLGVGAAILMETSRNKQDAWEFLKWWTDADAQFNFGRALEAVMGPAARWATANIQAFERMPWTAEIRQNLQTQIGLRGDPSRIGEDVWRGHMDPAFVVDGVEPRFGLKGVHEVPGGYYTGRHFDFARNDVLNENVNNRQDPRQRLMRAVIDINNEITRRREEFRMRQNQAQMEAFRDSLSPDELQQYRDLMRWFVN
jgi:hypothetical protein